MTHFVFLFLFLKNKKQKQNKTNTLEMEKKLRPGKLWKACYLRESFWSLTRILLFDKIAIQFLHQLRSQKTTS